MLLSKAALADVISPQQPQRVGAGGSPTPPPAQEGAALLTGSGSLGARCPRPAHLVPRPLGSQGEAMMNSIAQETSVLALDLLRPL